MTCPRIVALGAYVLGALEREERGELEGHLETCATCRGELDRLAPLPGLLARLSTEEAEELAGEAAPLPAEEPPSVVPPPRARRRTRRLAAVAAAAAVLAVAGAAAVGGGLLDDGGADAPAPLTTSASDPRTGVRASAELTERPWGTRVDLSLAGVRPGQRCRLVARTLGGRSEVAATWRATYVGTADVPGAVAVPPGRLLALDVVASSDRVLVRMPVSVD